MQRDSTFETSTQIERRARGGARFTHDNLLIAALDEVVILGHAARHELLPLNGTPAFERRMDRIGAEAVDLVERMRHHARELASVSVARP